MSAHLEIIQPANNGAIILGDDSLNVLFKAVDLSKELPQEYDNMDIFNFQVKDISLYYRVYGSNTEFTKAATKASYPVNDPIDFEQTFPVKNNSGVYNSEPFNLSLAINDYLLFKEYEYYIEATYSIDVDYTKQYTENSTENNIERYGIVYKEEVVTETYVLKSHTKTVILQPSTFINKVTIKIGEQEEDIVLYNPELANTVETTRVLETAYGDGVIPVVDNDDPNAGSVKVIKNNSVKSLAIKDPKGDNGDNPWNTNGYYSGNYYQRYREREFETSNYSYESGYNIYNVSEPNTYKYYYYASSYNQHTSSQVASYKYYAYPNYAYSTQVATYKYYAYPNYAYDDKVATYKYYAYASYAYDDKVATYKYMYYYTAKYDKTTANTYGYKYSPGYAYKYATSIVTYKYYKYSYIATYYNDGRYKYSSRSYSYNYYYAYGYYYKKGYDYKYDKTMPNTYKYYSYSYVNAYYIYSYTASYKYYKYTVSKSMPTPNTYSYYSYINYYGYSTTPNTYSYYSYIKNYSYSSTANTYSYYSYIKNYSYSTTPNTYSYYYYYSTNYSTSTQVASYKYSYRYSTAYAYAYNVEYKNSYGSRSDKPVYTNYREVYYSQQGA